MLLRLLMLIYGAGGYVLGTLSIAYFVGFFANLLVPKGINDGAPGELWSSIAINLGLIWLFGLHHSIAARPWFKALVMKIVPQPMERATYLYTVTVFAIVLFVFWRPIPITVWQVEAPVAVYGIYGLYLCVWAMMTASTFHFGHFGFFGLQQVWDRFHDRSPKIVPFASKYLYGLVRHPISLGWMLAPWFTPHMTVGQLVFAFGAMAYVLAATPFEEADLVEEIGERYRAYRKEVPAFIPRVRIAGRRPRSAPAE